MRWIIIMLLLMVVIPIVSAVTVQEGDVEFNTTESHTNYTNNLNTTTINITINKTGILFSQMNYTNGELDVKILHDILIDEVENAINTTAFPFLLESNNFTKNISSFFNKNINATLTFDVEQCDNLTAMDYTSESGSQIESFVPANFTCGSNRATIDIRNIEEANPPLYNLLNITYAPTSWRIAIISGLMSMAGLFVYVGNKQDSEFKPVKALLFGMAGLIGLLGIFVSILIATPNNGKVASLIETLYRIAVISFGFLLAILTIFLSKRGIEIMAKPQW